MTDHVDVLIEQASRILLLDAGHREFLRAVAEPGDEAEAAAAREVEDRNLLREAAKFDRESTVYVTAGRKAAQFVARTKPNI